ncbi:MAG: alanine racemase, partial [Pseudomonadota bacterium]|nr:alanine racemase [Pseudomonadota bacterium]
MSAVNAEYFAKLQKALKRAGLAEPVLVVDRQRLDANIRQLKTMLPADMGFRIVAKSLPCGRLLAHIATRAETDRLMSFNAAMALQMLELMPRADQLMGKPLPVAAVSGMFGTLPTRKRAAAARQIQFLVDTPQRVMEMRKLARRQKLPLRINLEIDVGLHRGGMEPGAALGKVLDALVTTSDLKLTGLMGYEPHLSKIPKLEGWRNRARKGAAAVYRAARAQLAARYTPADIANMTFNMAGSPTFGLYTSTTHANEISAGSALVKPGDFDLPILKAFQPAAFIA